MKKSSNTEQRIGTILERMGKVMPEIKRHIEVYEKNMKSRKQTQYPKIAPQFKNV